MEISNDFLFKNEKKNKFIISYKPFKKVVQLFWYA